MPQPTKIEQLCLEKTIIDLYTVDGLNTRQISERLSKREPPVSISHVTISKFLKDVKADAQEAAQTVRQEHVRKKLPGHLDTLDRMIGDLSNEFFLEEEVEVEDEATGEKRKEKVRTCSVRERALIAKTVAPLIELVIGKAPTDPPGGDEGGEGYLAEIERKLDSVVERRRKAAVPQEPDTPGSPEAQVSLAILGPGQPAPPRRRLDHMAA